ncbi:hypothetical protein RvY_01214 [Ramazzottius varieornatus]|uniref:Uncharacterized protein n=1 Tax=Ramazzottius varieornatus TaxID=947166 RepID=A0A1D1UJ29_RAMVA|nr:hypothetical protein RvY_01214 [Ramazzottius varieornatus]
MNPKDEDQTSQYASRNKDSSQLVSEPGSTASVQPKDNSVPVIVDTIAAVPFKVNDGQFWPFYRKLKPRPPLYDCHGRLANQRVPHDSADEEDPSLNAKFDPSRFVYPVQKNVQQAPRTTNVSHNLRPPKQSTLPSVSSLAVRKSDVNAGEQKLDRILSANRYDTVKNQQPKDPISTSRKETSKVTDNPVRPSSMKQPLVFRAFMLSHSKDSLNGISRKKKLKLSVGERVRQMQHHGVSISQDRVRQLVNMAKKQGRILEYAQKIDKRNKIVAVVIRKKQELREQKNQESVANAKEICKKACEEDDQHLRPTLHLREGSPLKPNKHHWTWELVNKEKIVTLNKQKN